MMYVINVSVTFRVEAEDENEAEDLAFDLANEAYGNAFARDGGYEAVDAYEATA